MCSYVVKVCSQLLCPSLVEDSERGPGAAGRGPVDNAVGLSEGATTGGALDVLDALESCFPLRLERQNGMHE